jgi:hypothetical protein
MLAVPWSDRDNDDQEHEKKRPDGRADLGPVQAFLPDEQAIARRGPRRLKLFRQETHQPRR